MTSQLSKIFALPTDTNNQFPLGRWLFYGIGNVGRQDDGLGIRLIENLESMDLPKNIDLQSNYQLNVEDALEISNYDMVIFFDATIEPSAQAPFQIRQVQPSSEIAFSTHAMTMEGVLALSDQLYGRTPRAFVLTMPGYHWEVIDQLSEKASVNLAATVQSIIDWVKSPSPSL